MKRSELCVALDTDSLSTAKWWVEEVKPCVDYIKIGMELFYSVGKEGYQELASLGVPVILDLKLHDIPTTMVKAAKVLMRLEPKPVFLTVHTSEAMKAVVDVLDQQIKVLAITVLTSTPEKKESFVSFNQAVGFLSKLAESCGAAGVVCSPKEAKCVKGNTKLLVMTPGVRPQGSNENDQVRVMTPQEAQAQGSDILVIGRPITEAASPRLAAYEIIKSLEA